MAFPFADRKKIHFSHEEREHKEKRVFRRSFAKNDLLFLIFVSICEVRNESNRTSHSIRSVQAAIWCTHEVQNL